MKTTQRKFILCLLKLEHHNFADSEAEGEAFDVRAPEGNRGTANGASYGDEDGWRGESVDRD